MIKDSSIPIKTKGCRKIKYYKDLGYDINKDIIYVKLKDINKGSRQKIEVIFDYCSNEVNITVKEYLRNIYKLNKYACSKKCGSLKAKESTLINKGVTHHMKLNDVKEKTKQTNLKKYGCEYLQQSNVFKKKSKNTILKKYGVDHISKVKSVKEKVRKTNLDRFGVPYAIMNETIKDKRKKNNLKKYNIDNVSKLQFVKNKVKKTNLEKYNNENYLLSDDFFIKSKKTMKNRWQSNNITKSEKFRKSNFSISKDSNYIKYIGDSYSLMKCGNGHNYTINIDNYLRRKEANLPLCTICNSIGISQSIKEKELYNFIKDNYNSKIRTSYRDGLEIDIYLPELNIGFEFNGLYWHSELYKDKNYHIDKSKYFLNKGIHIIHIWEDDWSYKNEIIKSQILNIIGKTENKIYARKCQVKEIQDSKIISKFLENNHIQGKVNSSLKLGLYYNNKLISVMTFDHFEGRKKMNNNEWNLSRFCSLSNYNVIGGFSKLLSFFIKSYNPNRIITYADRDWSLGKMYKKLGFKKIKETRPDYKYIVDKKRVHKSNFKKSNLNTSLTESQYMKENKINRIWDCGKIKFEMNI